MRPNANEPPPPSNIAKLATMLRHIPTSEAIAAALISFVNGELAEAREEAAGKLTGVRQELLTA